MLTVKEIRDVYELNKTIEIIKCEDVLDDIYDSIDPSCVIFHGIPGLLHGEICNREVIHMQYRKDSLQLFIK